MDIFPTNFFAFCLKNLYDGAMKNRFSKQRLWFVIFTLIIWAGLYFGNVKFSFGSQTSTNFTYSAATIMENLNHIQNITWKMRTSPGSLDAFLSVLKWTTKNLKIQTYDFTEAKIKSLFTSLLKRWTDIQLIQEDHMFQQFQSDFKKIQNYFSGYSNFAIKSDKQMGTEYTHSKINIVDSWFIIQTANLTHSSFFSNREHFFWSQNSWVLASLETIFDRDWVWEKIRLDDIHPNLVVCNINCRIVIEKLLSDAQESIIIQTQYITDPTIMDILQSKTGLEMKVLVSDTDSNIQIIKNLEWNVKTLKKPYNHTKMILIDKKILLLGSMNLSDNSLDNNREIWILLIDSVLIQDFLMQFQKDW